jgi:uncharacterized protein YcgI (DUF1989 family)
VLNQTHECADDLPKAISQFGVKRADVAEGLRDLKAG